MKLTVGVEQFEMQEMEEEAKMWTKVAASV